MQSQNSPLTLLAIETATRACSVALVHKSQIYTRFTIANNTHTQLILPLISEVLADANIHQRDLQAIAVGNGPGSFTGVRLAISIAQALAYALNIPVYPVSTLECLAWGEYAGQACMASIVIPAIDARMHECSFAIYQQSPQGVICLAPARLATPIQLVEQACLYDQKIIGIGSGWSLTTACPENVTINSEVDPDACFIAKIALAKYSQGEAGVSFNQLTPLYLRDEVAQKSNSVLGLPE